MIAAALSWPYACRPGACGSCDLLGYLFQRLIKFKFSRWTACRRARGRFATCQVSSRWRGGASARSFSSPSRHFGKNSTTGSLDNNPRLMLNLPQVRTVQQAVQLHPKGCRCPCHSVVGCFRDDQRSTRRQQFGDFLLPGRVH